MLMNYDSTKSSERVERKAIDKVFILDVVNKTTAYTGKKMLRNEIEGLVHYIKELDFNLMRRDRRDVIVDKIAKNFARQLEVRSGSIIDTHEVLKRHIGTIKHDGPQSLYSDTECPPFRATYGIRDPDMLGIYGDSGQNIEYRHHTSSHIDGFNEGFGTRARNTDETNNNNVLKKVNNLYLLLDSKFRNLSTDKNVFKWTVLHSSNTAQGTVNTEIDDVRNIVSIQFDRFNIPYVPSADNIYKKITLSIEEFSSMSVLLNTGRNYHMIFSSDKQDNQIQLTPLINDEGRYRFHTPIHVLDTITISFNSPFSPVEFLKDRFNVTIEIFSPTQSNIKFSEPHQVTDGELVYLEGFKTLNPTVDFNSIETINRENGHIVTFIDDHTLRIEIGLTNITSDPGNIVDCFIASRRIIIPLRMEYTN